jgi:integrase
MPRPAKPALELRGKTYRYVFTVAGHRFRGSTGTGDRGRAESYLAARWFEAHQRAHLPVASGPGAGLDLRQLAGMWLAELEQQAKERNPQYVSRHKLDVRYILGRFTLPGDISDEAWQVAMRQLHEEGLSWASLRHATVTLRHLLKYGEKLGAIAAAPILKPPRNRLVVKDAAPRRALSQGERDRVLRAMRAAGDHRAFRIWTAMAFSGLRRGELARLTLRSLDLRARVLHVYGKSGEHETIELHPEVRKAVIAEAAAAGVKDRGAPVFGGFDLRKAWKRALRRSKVDGHGTTAHHTARHTFGTLVAQEAHGDVTAVQAALRHRSLAMSAKYVHASAARARAAIRRL